eukprot:COSAG05_NODE_877_length_6812_cov_6.263370_8_plen_57_part_00
MVSQWFLRARARAVAEHEAEHDEFFSDEFDYSKNYGETIAIFTAVRLLRASKFIKM